METRPTGKENSEERSDRESNDRRSNGARMAREWRSSVNVIEQIDEKSRESAWLSYVYERVPSSVRESPACVHTRTCTCVRASACA